LSGLFYEEQNLFHSPLSSSPYSSAAYLNDGQMRAKNAAANCADMNTTPASQADEDQHLDVWNRSPSATSYHAKRSIDNCTTQSESGQFRFDETLLEVSSGGSLPSAADWRSASPTTFTTKSTEIVKNSGSSVARPTPTDLADLLKQQQQISNFFMEAAVRMASLLDKVEGATVSINNGADVNFRSKKVDHVCHLIEKMADKHHELAERVASIAEDALSLLEEKEHEIDAQKGRIVRLKRYIEERQPQCHTCNPLAIGDMGFDEGLPTEIQLPQTFIDLFQYLPSYRDNHVENGEDKVDKQKALAQRITSHADNGSIRFFL
jgi:hypothetical protein